MKQILLCLTLLILFTNVNAKTFGLDVSHHNGNVNFESWKKSYNVKFCFIKITEGVHFKDPMCKTNYKKAKKSGLKVGFYHYFRTNVSGKKQFNYMKKQLNKYKYDLIPVIDVESKYCNWRDPNAIKNLDEFINSFYKHYGYYPILYTIFDSIFKRYPQCIRWGNASTKSKKYINQNIYSNIDIDYCNNLSKITINKRKN